MSLAAVSQHQSPAAPTDPAAAIDACIARLDAQTDIGFERIAARCPDLAAKLAASGWGAWLPRGWNEPGNDLSAGGLQELEALGAGEMQPARSSHPLHVQSLRPILNRLHAASGTGSWSRLKAWLRSALSAETPAQDSWPHRLSGSVDFPQAMLELIAYIALGCVLVVAAVILRAELRCASWVRRRRIQSLASPVPPSAAAIDAPDIDRVPLAEQPRWILTRLINRLVDRNRLPPAGGLTVREVTESTSLTESEREPLFAVALVAERLRFSATQPTTADLEAPVRAGVALLRRLEMSEPA